MVPHGGSEGGTEKNVEKVNLLSTGTGMITVIYLGV
jgi:hypothetical protein